MSWYRRQLAEGQTFRCSSCGRIKRVKYVPTSNLCRSCASKKRRIVPNEPVSITDNIVVTSMVEKRLHNRAEKDIPRPKVEIEAYKVERWFWVLLALSAFAILPALFNESVWLALSLYVGLPILVHLVIKGILANPLRERQEQVALRTHELAEERKKKQGRRAILCSMPQTH